MKRVAFISHSSKDSAIGEKVCLFLEGHSIPCWIAPRDVMPGKNYGAAIVDAIDECSVFVLILSAESNKSGQVVREVERAASTNSVIIPLRIEPVQPSRDLEFYVSSSHWLDASEKPLDKHLGALVDAIRNWQSTQESQENDTIAVAPLTPPSRRRSNLPFVIGGAVLAIVVIGLAIFLANRPRTSEPQRPSTTAVASPGTQPNTSRMGLGRRRGAREQAANEARVPNASVPAESASPGPPPITSANQSSSLDVPLISEITASSEQHAEGQDHSPQMAFDGNPATTWLPQTVGVGQWIMVRFKNPATIASVSILNGNGFNQARYESSNRARSMRISFSDGTSTVIDFEQRLTPQRFGLPRPVVADWVKFEILSIFPGSKFSHTPIGEIQFNRPE